MRTIKFLLGILLLASPAWAGADRYGNGRDEITRSSFTDSTDVNVVIASATAEGLGALVGRRIIFSGMAASTVTFYDASLFTNQVTTVARFEYSPMLGGGNGSGSQPLSVDFDHYFSSGIMYNKQGNASVLIKWDWLGTPEYKGKRADPRP